jgi:hypothetical protein
LLARRFKDAVQQQPGLNVLRERLLALGDEAIVPMLEPDLALLLARGEPFGPTEVFLQGAPGRCHENVCRLPPAQYRIATGWALTLEDGLWRQHSWALDAGRRVVETTFPRIKHYGVTLTPTEAATFRENNL